MPAVGGLVFGSWWCGVANLQFSFCNLIFAIKSGKYKARSDKLSVLVACF